MVAAADASASSKARRKRKAALAAAGGGGGGGAAAAWLNAKAQQRAYQEAWLAFLRLDLPSDIYKKVSVPGFWGVEYQECNRQYTVSWQL